ncbi:hypothetical protein O3P69_011472 [Scylla paramamosain]|uniref:Uncharacterized protein n=1 Tax=Scylla paramamosain TaxID=85552 RepID=A0AAW0T6C3_SCYPA
MRGYLLLLLAGALLLSAAEARGYYGICFVGGKIVPNGSTWNASGCRVGKCTDGSVSYTTCYVKPSTDPSCVSRARSESTLPALLSSDIMLTRYLSHHDLTLRWTWTARDNRLSLNIKR